MIHHIYTSLFWYLLDEEFSIYRGDSLSIQIVVTVTVVSQLLVLQRI